MEWEVAALADEIVFLLAEGPATIAQLETATGRPAHEIARAVAGLFARFAVEPVGAGWRLSRARASVPV